MARVWFVTLLGVTTAAQKSDFKKWLNADPANLEAYRRVEATWQAMEAPGYRLAKQEAEELSIYLTAMERTKRNRRISAKFFACGLLVAMVLAGGAFL